MTRAGAARPDAIRRHNLGLLLTQIHRDGELSRAELTQRLDLSRSTVRALVAELAELGLVEEHVPSGGERAGRPSHLVGPRSDGPYAIAVDVDITHITTAAVGVGGHVLARDVTATDPSPSPPATVARAIVAAAERLGTQVARGAWPIGIGVSLPGTVGRQDGLVELAPNLGWRDAAFGEILTGLTPAGLPVSIGNDADVAVLAEHLRGNGRDCDDLVYLMGRIGVGAGVIVNGAPLRGRDGHAGEVGHTVVDASGPKCHCGQRGCVETYIGDNALLELAGRKASPTVDHTDQLFTDAHTGDKRAADAVRTVAQALGRTVATLVNLLNPELVILGGSLAGVLEFARADIRASLDSFAMTTARDAVQLRPPALGEDSALVGAAELAFARLLDDPLVRP
ncbi:MAG: ROK family transcriptional regulator [Jatrophihabitantaceae bacterium]